MGTRISGWACTYNTPADARGPSILMPGCFGQGLNAATGKPGQKQRDRVRLLWQHVVAEPLGRVTELTETPKGLEFSAELADDLPRAKEALALLRQGMLTDTSVGFDPLRSTTVPVSGLAALGVPRATADYFVAEGEREVRCVWAGRLWEISLVSWGAVAGSEVTNIESPERAAQLRQIDEALRARGLERASQIAALDTVLRPIRAREVEQLDEALTAARAQGWWKGRRSEEWRRSVLSEVRARSLDLNRTAWLSDEGAELVARQERFEEEMADCPAGRRSALMAWALDYVEDERLRYAALGAAYERRRELKELDAALAATKE